MRIAPSGRGRPSENGRRDERAALRQPVRNDQGVARRRRRTARGDRRARDRSRRRRQPLLHVRLDGAARRARRSARGNPHVVLDRPNPISGDPRYAGRRRQQEGFLSFVGLEPLPIRHALTARRDRRACSRARRRAARPGWRAERDRHPRLGALSHRSSVGSPVLAAVAEHADASRRRWSIPGGCLRRRHEPLRGARHDRCPSSSSVRHSSTVLASPPRWKSTECRAHSTARALPAVVREARGHRVQRGAVHVTDPSIFRPVGGVSGPHHVCACARRRTRSPSAIGAYEFETDIPAFDLLTGSSAAREAIGAGSTPEEVASLVSPVDAIWREVVLDAEARLERSRP